MTTKAKEIDTTMIKSLFKNWKTKETNNGLTVRYLANNDNLISVQFRFIDNDICTSIKRNNSVMHKMFITEVNQDFDQVIAYCNAVTSIVKCFE